ncbi:hypothetical protein [Tistlia consotensis]|uniref:hypothetical protein n=1 Tax=Tistlia consotensis TaxID=1321365 RepID=UPI00117E5248|nr:hypothetical protein [Tistlia consotensis]
MTLLFSNAAGTPKAYIVAHRCMIGAWPKPDDQTGNYKPNDIVTRACQFIQDQPGNAGVGDVYGSICDLAQRGLAGGKINQGISDVTPIVWSMAPGRVSAFSPFVAAILAPANVAEILTGAQAQDLEIDDLSTLLTDTSKVFDSNKRHDVARRILASLPVTLLEKPDGALGCWVSCVAEEDPGFAIDLLADDGFNDEQRNRILARVGDEALAEAPASLDGVLKDATRPKTRNALIERLTQVGKCCTSKSARSRLAERMIASLPMLSGEELHSVGRQIADLGGVSALERNEEVLAKLDAEQSRVLANAFPSSRRLRNALDVPES